LWEHFFYYDYAALANPDHRAFGWLQLTLGQSGWFGVSWLILNAFGVFAAVLLLKDRWRRHAHAEREWGSRANEPVLWRRPWVMFILMLVLIALSLNRDRAMPFSAGLALVWIVLWLREQGEAKIGRKLRFMMVAVVAGLMLPAHVFYFPAAFGFGLNRKLLPVGSTEFLQTEALQGRLFHTPGYGDYLLGALPKFRVFMDTRETIYRDKVQNQYLLSVRSPEAMASLLSQNGVGVVLLPIAFFWDGNPSRNLRKREAFFPHRDWALVAFDRISVVLARRVKGNQGVICRNEFVFLQPYLPAALVAKVGEWGAESADSAIDAEIERCRKWDLGNTFCVLSEAALLARSQRLSDLNRAAEQINLAIRAGAPHVAALLQLRDTLKRRNELTEKNNADVEQIGQIEQVERQLREALVQSSGH
jgi:hypothetical protein